MGITKHHLNLCVALTTLPVVWFILLTQDPFAMHTNNTNSLPSKDFIAINAGKAVVRLEAPVQELDYYLSHKVVFDIITAWNSDVSGRRKAYADIEGRYGGYAIYAALLGVSYVSVVFSHTEYATHFQNSVRIFLPKSVAPNIQYTFDSSAKSEVFNSSALFPSMPASYDILTFVDESAKNQSHIVFDALKGVKENRITALLIEGLSDITLGRIASDELQCSIIPSYTQVGTFSCDIVPLPGPPTCIYNVPVKTLATCSAAKEILSQRGCLLMVTSSQSRVVASKCEGLVPGEGPRVDQEAPSGLDALSMVLLSAPALVAVILLWNICKNWRSRRRR